MRRKCLIFIMALVVMLATVQLVANAQKPSKEVAAKEVRVGHAVILTGPLAHAGRAHSAGHTDYYNYINERGGIDGVKIRYYGEDNRFEPARTVVIYKTLKANGIVAMITQYASDCDVLAPLVNEDKIVQIAAGAGAPGAFSPPAWNYVVLPYYDQLFCGWLEYIKKEWSKPTPPKIALIGHDNVLGRGHIEPGRTYARKLWSGWNDYCAIEFIPPTVMDATANAMRIRDSGADFVYASIVDAPSVAVLKDFDKTGLLDQAKVCISMTALMEERGPALISPSILEKVSYVSCFDAWTEDTPGIKMAKEIQARFHPAEIWPEVNYHFSFVTAQVVVEALKRALKEGGYPITSAAVKKALDGMTNFKPLCGSMVTFGPNDRLGMNEMNIKAFRGGKVVRISDWPEEIKLKAHQIALEPLEQIFSTFKIGIPVTPTSLMIRCPTISPWPGWRTWPMQATSISFGLTHESLTALRKAL